MKRPGNRKITRIVIAFLAPGVFLVLSLLGAPAALADGPDGDEQVEHDRWYISVYGPMESRTPQGEPVTINFGRHFDMEVTISNGVVTGEGTDVTREGHEKPITFEGTISPDSEVTLIIYEENPFEGARWSQTAVHRVHGWKKSSSDEIYGDLETTLLRDGLEYDEGKNFVVGHFTIKPHYDGPRYTGPNATQKTVFTEAVPLPSELSDDPSNIFANSVFALLIIIVFYVASSIFNSTVRENYSTLKGWVSKGSVLLKPFRKFSGGPSLDPRAAFKRATRRFEIFAVLIISSVIYTFVDPYFSASLSGFNLFICLAIGIAALTFGYDGIQVLVSRRFGINSAIKTYPLAILIAIVFVAFSRMLNFRPGLLYGFIGAYTIVAVNVKPSTKQHGISVLLSSIVITAVALAAFFSRGLIPGAGAILENSWWQLLDIGLACVFALCLEGVLFSLIPMTFLDGARLLAWRKWVWAIVTAPIAFAFCWIIINKDGNLIEAVSETRQVQTMLGFTGFLLILSLATWAFFRLRKRRIMAVENITERQPAGKREALKSPAEMSVTIKVEIAPTMPAESIRQSENSIEIARLRAFDDRTIFPGETNVSKNNPSIQEGVKKMKYCPNCGARNPERANYCPECGAPVIIGAATSPDPETSGQPTDMNWFERHLNVTFFFGWLLIIGASVSILVPTFSVGDTNPGFAWSVTALVLIVWAALHIWITIWYLRKKHRSPAFFLLLVFTWLGVWILLGLKNKAHSALEVQQKQAAPPKVPYTSGGQLTFADHLERGFQSLRSGWDVNSATNHFIECLAQNPNNPEALLGLARCDIHEAKYDEARQYLERAAKVSPKMVDTGGWPGNNVNTWLGFTYLRTGFAGQAIASLQRAAELSREHYLTQRFLGEAYLEGGYAPEAVEAFETASQLNPSSEDPHMYLAVAYIALGNQAAADSEALLAKSRNPGLYPLSGEYLERVRKKVSSGEKTAIPKAQTPGTAGGPG